MPSATYEELRPEVEAGSRVPTERERSGLGSEQLLALHPIERRMLDRMGPEQRLRAGWRGELSAHQRGAWFAKCNHEVTVVNDTGKGGIPPWIAATLVDIVEEGVSDG